MAAIFWSKNQKNGRRTLTESNQLSRIQMGTTTTTTTPACFRYMLLIWFKWYERFGHDVGVGYAVSEDFEINPQFFEDTSDLVILRRANGLISGWDSGSHLPISKTRPVIRWTKSLSPFQPIETEMQPPSWPIEVADRLSLLWLQQHPLRRRRQRDEGCQEVKDVEERALGKFFQGLLLLLENWGQIYVYVVL